MTSVVLAFELFLSLVLGRATAPAAPDILHEPLPCVAPGRNPVVDAVIPGEDIRTAKVYFRSDKYPKFYYVEMKPSAAGFLSVLPKPSPETGSIIYYIEAIDVTFNNTIGVEYTAVVSEDCPQAEPAEREPGIVVGATEAGAAALPPGFETAGIVGTITAVGLGSVVSGGSGIGTGVVIGGVAAGVGGAVAATVVVHDEPTELIPDTPVSAPAPPPPTPSPTPPSSPGPPPAPVPGPEPEPEPPPPPAPVPTTPVTACFTVSFPGRSCNLKLDAACSTGTISSYDWEIAATPTMGGVTNLSGLSVNRNFPTCSGESVNVTLTVADGAGATDVRSSPVTLPMELTEFREASPTRRVAFTSFLDARPLDGAFRGMLRMNGTATASVRNVAPVRHEHDGRHGKNVIDASLVSGVGTEALWIFDFRDTERFVRGSIRPLQGVVLTLNARRVVFRLSGASSEHVRFEYELAP